MRILCFIEIFQFSSQYSTNEIINWVGKKMQSEFISIPFVFSFVVHTFLWIWSILSNYVYKKSIDFTVMIIKCIENCGNQAILGSTVCWVPSISKIIVSLKKNTNTSDWKIAVQIRKIKHPKRLNKKKVNSCIAVKWKVK